MPDYAASTVLSPRHLGHRPDTAAPPTPTGWLARCVSLYALSAEAPMAQTDAVPHPSGRTSWWHGALLGIVLIIVGLLVLRDATAATVVSAIVFGVALLCAGLAEIVQAFGSPHWSGVV